MYLQRHNKEHAHRNAYSNTTMIDLKNTILFTMKSSLPICFDNDIISKIANYFFS